MNREMREHAFTSTLRQKIDERDEKIIKCMTIIGTLESENATLVKQRDAHAEQIARLTNHLMQTEQKLDAFVKENMRLVDTLLSTRSRLQKVLNSIGGQS